MNIADARQIDLRTLAEHLGGQFSHQSKPDELWLYSPFRPDERTASFKINSHKNLWYDFATGTGGSTLDLWLDYHSQDRKSSTAIRAALQGLRQFATNKPTALQQYKASGKDYSRRKQPQIQPQNRFQLIKPPGRIWHGALLEEIGRRRLSLATVAPFLRQADIRDTKTGNKLTGFAFQNDEFGWEISIPNPKAGKSFKTSFGKKAPSSFTNEAHDKALIFEGFWDYLTWVQMQKTSDLKADVYVMNSLSFKTQVADSIIATKRIEKVLLFLDNDDTGEKATVDLVERLQCNKITVGTMNHVYQTVKDLNLWHMVL